MRHVVYALAWSLLLGFSQSVSLGAPAGEGAPSATFAALDDINAGTIARLKLIISFHMAKAGGYSGAPAISGDTLFLQTPFPHTIYALDLMQPAAPIRWQVTPKADGKASGLSCCDRTTGGPVLAGDRLYLSTFDGHTLALAAATGRILWDATIADPAKGESLAAAPLMAEGRVVVGNGGDDFGVRGWIAALDAATGHMIWKYFTTGPDREIGIGPRFNPASPADHGEELGLADWPSDAWLQGGGGLSGGMVYDADHAVLVYGTGHPAPWNPARRPGDNRWTSGLFARDPATGEARWFDVINPHDLYALGAGGSIVAADLPWQGESRSLLIHPDANGQVYVLDRLTGAVLSVTDFLPVNATRGFDLAKASLIRNDAKAINPNSTMRDICPAWPGATGGGVPGAAASAFSPETGLLYIPVNRLCMDLEARDASYIAGTPFIGANLRMTAHGQSRGAVIGWDIARSQPAWTADEPFPVESGVLATQGGLIFYGTLDGAFKALDAGTGRLLWQFQTVSGIIGQPVTFRLSNGRQYVAVVAGVGGASGRVAQNDIDRRDATAARGYANVLRDLRPPVDPGGTLYIFALP
jgi:lanthanide-dependent methanol dehydrogenase